MMGIQDHTSDPTMQGVWIHVTLCWLIPK